MLDLGSGGGIDVLLSARRVGPTGKVYGLDMTDEMLALALENKRKAGASNVEFLKGHIEAIPLPADTVDVIISNCVINLSGDKRGHVQARADRGAAAPNGPAPAPPAISRLKGATPANAAIVRRSSRPNSGSSASNVRAVVGPTPGTVRSRSSCTRQSGLLWIAWSIS